MVLVLAVTITTTMVKVTVLDIRLGTIEEREPPLLMLALLLQVDGGIEGGLGQEEMVSSSDQSEDEDDDDEDDDEDEDEDVVDDDDDDDGDNDDEYLA